MKSDEAWSGAKMTFPLAEETPKVVIQRFWTRREERV
jgi:hypothetical protein